MALGPPQLTVFNSQTCACLTRLLYTNSSKTMGMGGQILYKSVDKMKLKTYK